MAKGMAIQVRVLQSFQVSAMVAMANRTQNMAAAATDGRYFQR